MRVVEVFPSWSISIRNRTLIHFGDGIARKCLSQWRVVAWSYGLLQSPPRCVPDASQILPRCLPDASNMSDAHNESLIGVLRWRHTRYCFYFGATALYLRSWLAAAVTLHFLWRQVHANTYWECRLWSCGLLSLASEGYILGQCVGVAFSIFYPFCAPRCWSCDRQGRKRPAQTESKYHGCCKSCFNRRSCTKHGFNKDTELGWCSSCKACPMRWCEQCHTAAVLDLQQCRECHWSDLRDKCWSCVAAKGADSAKHAVPKPGRNQDACELFLCAACWNVRHCTLHGETVHMFLDDMSLGAREESISGKKPRHAELALTLPLCSVCRQMLAVACPHCLNAEEAVLRGQGIHRCSNCVASDLVVKGRPRNDAKNVLSCGTCAQGVFCLSVAGKPNNSRGSCNDCHVGRQCPTCSDYCWTRKPSMCKECFQKTPPLHRVALWCTSCLLPEDIELQLCRSCHPSTKDVVDKAVVTHAEEKRRLNDLLYAVPVITGAEPALQQHIFQGCPNDEEGTANMPSTLPKYSEKPEPMSGVHCRLCLRDCRHEGQDPLETLPLNNPPPDEHP